MKTPKFLYHSSQDRNIQVFAPRAESMRDPNEGPVVFATPSKSYSSCFIVKTDGSWVDISSWDGGETWHFVCSDKERFIENDKGGAIYTLENEGQFSTDSEKGTGESEWISKDAVKPISKEEYESGLNAMLSLGVKVYFVNENQFKEIQSSSDYGFDILQTLKSFSGELA